MKMSLYSVAQCRDGLPFCFGDPFSAPSDEAAKHLVKSAIFRDLEKIDLDRFALFCLCRWDAFDECPLSEIHPYVVVKINAIFSDEELKQIKEVLKQNGVSKVSKTRNDGILQSGKQVPDRKNRRVRRKQHDPERGQED